MSISSSSSSSSPSLLAQRTQQSLHDTYPNADCALNYSNAHELLIATILSAQSTDANVNRVTVELFRKYPTLEAFAEADPEELQEDIRATGFFRNKTRHVVGAARKILEEHGGEVPDTIEELVELPGVARKTANVVLGTYFKKPAGFVVDTHVKRVAYRIGLTDAKRPEKVEQDLMALFPQAEWIFLGHALIWHGRTICQARRPQCGICALEDVCLQRGVNT